MIVSELSANEKRCLGIRYGLRITSTEVREINNTNINEGFIITKVDGVPINSLRHFRELMHMKAEAMLDGIYDDGTHAHYYIEVSPDSGTLDNKNYST